MVILSEILSPPEKISENLFSITLKHSGHFLNMLVHREHVFMCVQLNRMFESLVLQNVHFVIYDALRVLMSSLLFHDYN